MELKLIFPFRHSIFGEFVTLIVLRMTNKSTDNIFHSFSVSVPVYVVGIYMAILSKSGTKTEK